MADLTKEAREALRAALAAVAATKAEMEAFGAATPQSSDAPTREWEQYASANRRAHITYRMATEFLTDIAVNAAPALIDAADLADRLHDEIRVIASQGARAALLAGERLTEIDALRAALSDPTAVRANILAGRIATPPDIVWLHDTNGPVAELRARAEKAEAERDAWRESIESALGLQPDPPHHTPRWAGVATWIDAPDADDYRGWPINICAVVNGRRCDVWQTGTDGSIWWSVLDRPTDDNEANQIASESAPSLDVAKAAAESAARGAK